MRSIVAASAALSAALLLAACSGTDDGDSAPEATTEVTETTEAAADSTHDVEAVDTLTTCAGYYDGGELSIHARVTEATDAVAEPATEENAADLTIIRDRLESQILYAEDDTAELLRTLQAQFDTSLSGEAADPAAVTDAAGSIEALCTDAGFTVPAE